MYRAALDKVTGHFAGDRYAAELARAREEFFRRTGKVFEDEPMFENRITACLEWYLFDRILKDVGVPPVRLFYIAHRSALDPAERRILESLQRTRHSLYEYLGRAGSCFRVRDLWDGRVHEVTERRTYAGVSKGDILDARLIFLPEGAMFSDAMWLHPAEARRFVLEEVRKTRIAHESGFEALLFDLAYMKLKQDRYRHLGTPEIYNWSSFRRDRNEGS
ncbi:MAG: hypothetical protein V1798_11130 [Pseudomonadota bacterium]